MSQYILHFQVPEYLAQWLRHEQNSNPVKLTRGSVEADVLEYYLCRQPTTLPLESVREECRGNLEVFIPSYASKDVRIWNYLPPKSAKVFIDCIHARFVIQLWQEIHKLENVGSSITDLIFAFMERHGIEDDGKSWETLRQIYYRRRNAYRGGSLNKRKLKIL